MTEAEWLAETDPVPMMSFLEGKASDRKLRLFACACCRRIWHLLADHRSRISVDTAERFADGSVSEQDRAEASRLASAVYYGDFEEDPDHNSANLAAGTCVCQPNDTGLRCESGVWLAVQTSRCVCAAVGQSCADGTDVGDNANRWRAVLADAERAEQSAHTVLIKDIFGNPLRQVTVNPSWLTSTVLSLANGIYNDKAFDRMPILADALMDAGCDNEDILNHCREQGEHWRGCWVVDLCLNKS